MEWKEIGLIIFVIGIMYLTCMCLMCWIHIFIKPIKWNLIINSFNICHSCNRAQISVNGGIHPPNHQWNIGIINTTSVSRYIGTLDRCTLPPVVLSIETLPTYDDVTKVKLPTYDEAVRVSQVH